VRVDHDYALDVEAEVDDVAVFDFVGFAFDP
jgi:hypothetical protein